MTYNYKNIEINLDNEEVYFLWNIIAFALDYDAEKKCLTDEKRAFAKRLLDITGEMK